MNIPTFPESDTTPNAALQFGHLVCAVWCPKRGLVPRMEAPQYGHDSFIDFLKILIILIP